MTRATNFFCAGRNIGLQALGLERSDADAPSMSPKKAKKLLRRGSSVTFPKITEGEAEAALLPRLCGANSYRVACVSKGVAIDANLDAGILVDCSGIIGALALSSSVPEAEAAMTRINKRAEGLVSDNWQAIISAATAA
jgi:hypothetical protein